jgi:hypothetical protein
VGRGVGEAGNGTQRLRLALGGTEAFVIPAVECEDGEHVILEDHRDAVEAREAVPHEPVPRQDGGVRREHVGHVKRTAFGRHPPAMP